VSDAGGGGGGLRAVDEKPHQKTHLPTTMGHLLKTNIDNNATQKVRETEEHDNRRTYDCIEKNNGPRKIMTVKYRLSHNYRLIVPVLDDEQTCCSRTEARPFNSEDNFLESSESWVTVRHHDILTEIAWQE